MRYGQVDLRHVASGVWLAALLSLSLACGPVLAQDDVDTWAPETGDTWVDAQLADINRYAERYRDAFVDELVRYQGAPRALVEEALEAGIVPSDVYYACALAQAFGRPCRDVLEAWRADASDGWTGVASRLEPERADAARDRVKRGIVESYDRWARPVSLDASLRRVFPERNQPPR